MVKCAVIDRETHEVMNVIEWDKKAFWHPPENHYIVEHEDCKIGHIYDLRSGKFNEKKVIDATS